MAKKGQLEQFSAEIAAAIGVVIEKWEPVFKKQKKSAFLLKGYAAAGLDDAFRELIQRHRCRIAGMPK